MGERDSYNAETWYRKAANQGYAPAQGKLGNFLLMHYRTTFGLKPEIRASLGEEALKWMTLAANQGDAQGQANLADVCLEGKLAKQDYIESYKWGELASESGGEIINFPALDGRSKRDSAILKMNADDIAEAKRRVAEFKPHVPAKSEKPQPAWVKKIKLQGISGPADHRLAIINGKTLEKGDEETLKIDGNHVAIHCIEISEASVSISIEGIEGTQELKYSDD